MEQVRKLLTGEYTSWKQVGGPDKPVVVFAASEEHRIGTYRFVTEEILKGNFAPVMKMVSYYRSIPPSVAETEGAIGIIRMRNLERLIEQGLDTRIKVHAVKKDDRAPAITPTRESIDEGFYPMTRPYFLIVNSEKTNKCVLGSSLTSVETGTPEIKATLVPERQASTRPVLRLKWNTILSVAAVEGKADKVAELLKKGANPDARNVGGITVLMEAAGGGETAIVKALLDHGAKIDLQDRRGMTALMEAAEKGKIKEVKMLVEKGADLNLRSATGATALAFALAEKNTEVAAFLKSKGAK